MRLRVKVLGLFLLLGMLPLVALGAVEYIRSLRAVESLLVAQNARLADRAAAGIAVRTRRLESDVLLLTDNAESQRWLRREANDTTSAAELQRFLADALVQMRGSYRDVALTDAGGRSLTVADAGINGDDVLAPFVRTIRDDATGRELGTIRVRARTTTLLRTDEVAPGFGERGHSVVIDRATGAMVYHSVERSARRELPAVLGPDINAARLTTPSGSLRYVSGDTVYVAAFHAVTGVPWTVIMSAAVSEFSAPFATVGRSTVLIFGGVAVLATMLFGAMIGRVTGSLEELTAAASVVGAGNFAPTLPPASADEVGRLSAAFGSMVARVRDMMDEVRAQRQMAVLGEFAAQLSHEVRNPLTAIKLNLQRIERFLAEQQAPVDTAQSMTIALREVGRLDAVVRGVLQLARHGAERRESRSLNTMLLEVCEMLQDHCAAQHVQLKMLLADGVDVISVDCARFKGAILNLMNNALEAMPDGGQLWLDTRIDAGVWQLTITDSGPGISPADRSRVFRPFETTKGVGTGLGLPLARRAMEEHGGTLELAESPIGTGATFVVRVPVSAT